MRFGLWFQEEDTVKRLLAMLVVGFVVSFGVAADDKNKDELKKFEGTWDIESIEADGRKLPRGMGAPERAVVEAGKISFFTGGKKMPTFRDLALEFDPKSKPKAVNLVRGKNERLPCIYEVTERSLKLAIPLIPRQRDPKEPLPRPKSFETKGKPIMVLTAKRGKK